MRLTKTAIVFAALSFAATAHATGINRKIIAEIDPIAPTSSMYEEKAHDITTSKFGALVDFNVGGVVSTGPEIWTGTFTAKGGDAGDPDLRREDMWPGERHKLDAIRLRWNISWWEHDYSMRGWYLKGGYSYTRINSRANRYTELAGPGDAVPTNVTSTDPMDETDLVSDLRHGGVFGFGNRWFLAQERMTITLGASFTSNFRRSVTVDSKDPHALADYEAMIESLPDTRMTTRPTPEANLTFGYAW